MKQDKMLAQMKAVTNALYLREHAKVKPILDAEAQLRSQIDMLKTQIAQARPIAEESHAIKALGADFLWQQWHTKSRRELNQQLAQVTAQKLQAMDKLRASFGRKHAVETMETQERELRRKLRAQKLQQKLLGLE
ncbi:hypothetical protein TRM7557_02576 [Tritonibacter multivorans]|uniref:Flagellar FliJ protein n=1 Tax=Tritonibacter multivorans TaxID=928856 RepID=A0A0P1GDN6_9RHOB|nr:hypothetical protein [Tritonibacter multivorans]MDA7420153.1 hypothetical protein [Tritonibacter multivorans]CUH79791.1 hypothetical protein TRM7557_02576 [Tritonibacter multivorans]SFC02424.1 hypothetical protein SAMN04488049_101142 [Tritonibacter multivorans]